MKIKVGDIYWLKLESKVEHPHVVIKVNKTSVVVCAITTNRKKVSFPGNVVLDLNEGNLDKLSIVEVSKVFTVDSKTLINYIGSLNKNRVNQILKGIEFIKRSFLDRNF